MRYCSSPNCSTLVRRGRCAQHAIQREHDRGNYDVRRWYRTARWCHPVYGLRAQVLRDEPCCSDCNAEGRVDAATEVHHKVRHHGDPDLFWSRANLTGLCRMHHSRRTQRGE
jgi:5-methylcytosine-specific restriction enzyme A